MKAIAQAAQPAAFTFNDTHSVRVETDDQGAPWFCAKDVCAVLGYANDSDTVKKHCRQEGVAKRYPLTAGGRQGLAFINEGNLYRLIIKSRLPAAQRFEAWVCDEVLPSIRKTGLYVSPDLAGPGRPTPGGEALSAGDMANLRRAIWHACVGAHDPDSWCRAIWKSLRAALAVPHPQPFLVDHLPALEQQLRELLAVSDTVRAFQDQVNVDALKALTAAAGPAGAVVAIQRAAGKLQARPDPLRLSAWREPDLRRLLQREAPVLDHHHVAE